MAAASHRTTIFLIAGLLIMAAGFYAFEKFTPEPSIDGIQSGHTPTELTQPETMPATTGDVDVSIAVLPFENTSADPAQDYLSGGLARELLERLSDIPGLQVASRSSSFQFNSKQSDIKAAADSLGVANVLTGSVQQSDDTLQVEAALTRAADGTVLWTDTYERSLRDVFAIQDDITAAVASTLQVMPEGGLPAIEAVNPEAYLLWLQGRYFYGLWGEENFERAVDANRAALKIDPDYVEAWASLAVIYLTQTQSGYRETAIGTALTRNAIDKALAIDPNRASVLARLAHVQLMIEWDWTGAEQTLERALRVAPRDTRVLGAAAYLANCFGRSDEALGYLERALAEDPKNMVTMYNLAEVLHRAGRLNEATDAYRRLLELNPKDQGTHTQLAIIMLQQGDPEAAWRELELEPEPQQQEYGRLLALPALARSDEVEERLNSFIEKNQSWGSYFIANIYAWHGDKDNAFLWLNHAYQQRAGGITQVLLEPTLAALHDDPRWDDILQKLGLQD